MSCRLVLQVCRSAAGKFRCKIVPPGAFGQIFKVCKKQHPVCTRQCSLSLPNPVQAAGAAVQQAGHYRIFPGLNGRG